MRRDSLDLARIRDVLRRLEEALDQNDLVPAFERALSEAP
jgi:hypothetical protein